MSLSVNGYGATVKTYYLEGSKTFDSLSTLKPMMRLCMYGSDIFNSVKGRIPLPKLVADISSAYNLIDGLSIFSSLEFVMHSKKFEGWQDKRPMKALGLISLTVADAFGFVALLGAMQIVDFSKIAGKMASFTRIPAATCSFAFSAAALGCVVVGFALLFAEKYKKEETRARKEEHRQVKNLKLAEYLTGAVGAAGACAGLLTGSSYLVVTMTVIGIGNETLKIARAMYRKVNAQKIKG